MSAKRKLKAIAKPVLLKLDLGCGTRKQAGFIGVDERQFEGVDHVADLRKPWPWKDGTVEEVHCSHFVEHLDGMERVHFVRELYRVLIPGGKATVVVPHWASCRAYGDVTHKWPPVSEMWFYYLSKEWRKVNAPHNDFYGDVDFECGWGYNMKEEIRARNMEYQQHALQNFKEAATDIISTWTKRV